MRMAFQASDGQCLDGEVNMCCAVVLRGLELRSDGADKPSLCVDYLQEDLVGCPSSDIDHEKLLTSLGRHDDQLRS